MTDAMNTVMQAFNLTQNGMSITEAMSEINRMKFENDVHNRFWFCGEIGDQLNSVPINSNIAMRKQRIMQYMDRNKLHYHEPWLMQLIKWHSKKAGGIKSAIVALKYYLLDESMRRGIAWTIQLDEHAEALALEAYQAHKRKGP